MRCLKVTNCQNLQSTNFLPLSKMFFFFFFFLHGLIPKLVKMCMSDNSAVYINIHVLAESYILDGCFEYKSRKLSGV